jgi:Bacteriophage tail sheath protein
MPATLSYPGVYIEEIPSGVHTITGVATSVAAFIDFFREGPMNKAVQIFGMADFQREFGGLDDRSEAGYAISQFFLNGGSEAWVIRVGAKDAANTSPANFSAANVKAEKGAAGTVIMDITAASEGVWGNNIRVDIDHNTSDPTNFFNVTVTRYDSPTSKAKPIAVERHLNLAVDPSSPRYFVSVINDQSKLIRVSHPAAGGTDATSLPAASGTTSGELSGTSALAQTDFDALSGKKLHVKIGSGSASDTEADATLGTWAANAVTNLRDLRSFVENAIRSVPPGTLKSLESFASATVEVVGGTRLRVLSGRSGQNYSPTELVVISKAGSDLSSEKLLFSGTSAGNINNVQQYQLGLWGGTGTITDIGALKPGVAGNDGILPGATEIIGSDLLKSGIYALRDVDIFNILCLPRAAEIGGTLMDQIIAKALAFCKERRAFLIIDIPPSINEVQEVKDWLDAHNPFRDRNTALYFPRLKIPDPLDDFRLRSVGASGTMAGLYARIDSNRGVWKAPAGTEATMAGVVELDTKLTDPQNGTLNPLAINCARTFPVHGNVAWGARTLDGSDQAASEWKYIPVRRLALFLEESLFRGTKWVVFEPNDEPLWAQIRLNLGAFMHNLFRQGAFQGMTPKDAYFVKCDKETTTQNDINLGVVNIVVGFAPLKPAEFVVIKIQQMAGQIET